VQAQNQERGAKLVMISYLRDAAGVMDCELLALPAAEPEAQLKGNFCSVCYTQNLPVRQ
jgi:hypothetical protein